ncbi:hypothetical protein ACHAXN_005148 [Cyclotella atomus]
MQNGSEYALWSQDIPTIFMNCRQLVRSLQTSSRDRYEPSPTLSSLRLAQRMDKLDTNSQQRKDPFKIVVIGGSMTTGFVDITKMNVRELAWPTKLLNFMQHHWPHGSIDVVNLAIGGANEESWLGNIDLIANESPIDVILVESAVNDQCEYKEQVAAAQEVNRTSFLLLDILINLPSQPAVFSVELFRTAYRNKNDANKHCPGHVNLVVDRTMDHDCFYCEQWYKPQDWRKSARDGNSVSYISYRDAIWEDLHHPPEDLCQYWSGLSHPLPGVHSMVASTVLFTFLLTFHKKDALVAKLHGMDQIAKIESKSSKQQQHYDDICVHPITSFHAEQGNPVDPMNIHESSNNSQSCWDFRADSKEKYGWVCEVQNNVSSSDHYYLLQKNIRIGKQRLVIVSRLVSYDERMATAQVWFGSPNSNSNIFVGNPVWNITSSHDKKTSIPQSYSILLDQVEFKESGLSSDEDDDVEVMLIIKMMKGSSKSSWKGSNGIDKFKLLGIVSC